MTRHKKGTPDPLAVKLASWATEFVNTAWARRLRPSKDLVDAIQDALENAYTEDHIRSVFWVAATLPGDEFIKDALRAANGMLPAILLRFHGRVNNQTGKDAIRWLDILEARVGETAPVLISEVLARVQKVCGEGPANDELAFLKRAGFPVNDGKEE